MRKKSGAEPQNDMVYGWHGIGDVLDVSYMTAKRWAARSASLRAVIQTMRSVCELRTGKRRIHVMASRRALLAWQSKLPSLESAERSAPRPRRRVAT